MPRHRDRRLMAPGPRTTLLVTAAAALLIGWAIYAIDRGPGSAQWLPDLPLPVAAGLFGAAAGWLPSAVHTYAFGVCTALAIGPLTPRVALGACTAWALIDALAEGLQHGRVAPHVIGALDGLPALQPLRRYVSAGTFDVRDLVAALCGAALAAGVLIAASRGDRGAGVHG